MALGTDRPLHAAQAGFPRRCRAAFAHRLVGPTTARQRRRFYGALSTLVIAACAWLGLRQSPILFPLDDAYITLHNAQVLLAGTDVNYPGVPALVGATSVVHLALVTLLMRVIDPLWAGFLVGSLAILLYALGLARLAFDHGASRLLAAALTALGLLGGYAPYQLLNGLETGAMMAAVVWALVLAGRSPPGRGLPALCGLMPFLRPELAALSILLMLHQAWTRWWSRHSAGDAARAILLDGIFMLLVAAPWALWCWLDTGALTPSTAMAKQAFFAEANLPAATRLAAVLRNLVTAGFGPLWLGLILLRGTRLAWPLWGFSIAFALAFFSAFPMGIGQNHFRYVYVFLPLMIYALTASLRLRRNAVAPLALVAALIFCVATLPRPWAVYADERERTRELASLTAWARENIPADAKILVHDAGYVAFASRFALVDVVGLKTPESVAYHLAWTAPTIGRDRHEAIHRIAQRFRPAYAIILNDAEGYWSSIGKDLRMHGWDLRHLHSAAARNSYELFSLLPPPAD